MSGQSRAVTTNQTGIHPDLKATVRKHLSTKFKKPYRSGSIECFQNLMGRVETEAMPIIFDSGCGTGESTLWLAKRNPKSFVVGIDKSKVRIDKANRKTTAEEKRNLVFIQADVVDIWRLAVDAGWSLQSHFILYPNPWPKKLHLKRRWHGHPVLPYLLKLRGTLLLRSNWRLYLEEFACAVELTGRSKTRIRNVKPGEFDSAFEKKYSLSGQVLFEYRVNLDDS